MSVTEECLRSNLVNGKLPCKQAFFVAQKLGLSPMTVGKKAFQLGIKISACQLGLFDNEHNNEQDAETTHSGIEGAAEMALAIRARLVDGQLPCAAAWALADQYRIRKKKLSETVDALGIRISSCQLGCFD